MQHIGRLVLAMLVSINAWAQPSDATVTELRSEWKVAAENGYRNYEGQHVQTIYFSLDESASKGSWLRVGDIRPFGVFVNQKLIADRDKGGAILFRLDSLAAIYSWPVSVAVYERSGISSLSTRLLKPPSAVPDFVQYLIPRKGNYFMNFVLLGSFVIGIYFTILVTSNPRLTIDYLNAAKLFSLQREETTFTGRVTSRVNMLFYIFCCLSCSLIVVISFNLAGDLLPGSYYFQVSSTGQGFLQWFKLAFLVASLLVVKVIIVFVCAELFGIREVASIQYFHFVRALMLATVLIGLVTVANFIFKGQSAGLHSVMLKLGAGVLVLSAMTMYLKLLGLTRHHFFHLFSYLCASEIIPLVIVLKVLLY